MVRRKGAMKRQDQKAQAFCSAFEVGGVAQVACKAINLTSSWQEHQDGLGSRALAGQGDAGSILVTLQQNVSCA